MSLQTTTHLGRNIPTLRAAASLVEVSGRPVRALQVGPGLAVRYLGRMTGEGASFRMFFKGLEALVRRLSLPNALYENYESAEIVDVFGARPLHLTVIDITPKSLAVVASTIRPLGVEVTPILGDISDPELIQRRGLGEAFDIVIALNMVLRLPDHLKQNAAENLVRATAPGGIMVENSLAESRFRGLQSTSYSSIYRRLARLTP